jgi:hypothetical protein
MTTKGIEAVYIETHNWGKTAKFFQTLGFDLEFSTDHNSGLLRNGAGPYLFVAEVPEDQPTGLRLVLAATSDDPVEPGDAVEVVTPYEDTHYGAKEMQLRDPDGRIWILQSPPS